jgi:hypothetical protein
MREPWLSGAAGEMLLGYELVPQRLPPTGPGRARRALECPVWSGIGEEQKANQLNTHVNTSKKE